MTRTFGSAVLCLAATLAHANTWTGAGADNYWNTGANWLEGARPGWQGVALFTGDAAATPQPDANGQSQTGLALDFQSAGWTVSDSVGGANFRVDYNLYLRSLGAGVNTVFANVTGSGGPPPVTVGTGNTLHLRGGFTALFSSLVGGGTLVVDSPGETGAGGTTAYLHGGATLLVNCGLKCYLMVASSGTIGGTGTILGYQYQSSLLTNNAALAPGGNGTFGNEIGTLTWKSQSATVRHNLVLKDGARMVVQLGETLGACDKLVFHSYGGGRLTLGANVTLDLIGGSVPDGEYTIIENAATDMTNILGTFATVNLNGQPADPAQVQVSYLGDAVTVTVSGLQPSGGTLLMVK